MSAIQCRTTNCSEVCFSKNADHVPGVLQQRVDPRLVVLLAEGVLEVGAGLVDVLDDAVGLRQRVQRRPHPAAGPGVAPPSTGAFSATITFRPWYAAVTAAARPAAPPPTTSRSQSSPDRAAPRSMPISSRSTRGGVNSRGDAFQPAEPSVLPLARRPDPWSMTIGRLSRRGRGAGDGRCGFRRRDGVAPPLVVSSYTLGTEVVFTDRVRAAAAAGFDGIGLRAENYWAARAAGLDDAAMARDRRRGRRPDAGGRVRHRVGDPGRPRRGSARKEQAVFHMARAFGVRHVNTGLLEKLPRDVIIEAFGALCDRAGDDLTVALEFMPYSGVPDLATAWQILDDAGRANSAR